MRKSIAGFLTLCMIFTFFSIDINAEEKMPTPPSLYSQAAVLMDGDTGQVIWGKNMHTTMYPASLTKVVTCLLAMEKGNPADVVTMTDEGVFSVPRGTTHAALTPGEQLTLEQLEYVMMVESANDAANGLAIHLAGSMEAFAQMMNDKAVELGATGSRFTNANGLPDPGHYTTAYDLGLFTREALTYPEFRSLAGTKQYEVPPTNKQKETRKFNNRQYMFCLGDTYPGAFAGKTGWTEEAGKTLITIAERDGITLIAVVMKAAGTVDAEFKDSTALLDYGYDNFSRVVLPKDRVQPQLAPDTGEVFVLEEDMPILLPKGMTAEQVKISVDTADPAHPSVQVLAAGLGESMEVLAGEFAMTVKAEEAAAPPEAEPKKPKWEFHWNPTFLKILKWCGIVLGILALVAGGIIYMLRRIALKKQRRRRRSLEMKKRAMQRAYEERLEMERKLMKDPSMRIIDVTQDKAHKNRIQIIKQDKR